MEKDGKLKLEKQKYWEKILKHLAWSATYIPELIKIIGGFIDKVVSLFNTNTPKQTVDGRGRKLRKPKSQKQSKENIINSIRNPFLLKKEKKKLKIE